MTRQERQPMTPGRERLKRPAWRCEMCRWWSPFPEGVQPKRMLESLSAASVRLDLDLPSMGDCTLFECRGGEQIHDAAKLEVSRTGTGEATIITHGDFGCVQWEVKP